MKHFWFTAKDEECCSTQLIDGDGAFNATGMEHFIKDVRLAECGLSYAVVSIMGPQSSGKSTLLNHLFGTNFREMDAFKGRCQTTKGIWVARCAGIEPCTLVMDLEGTDGRERGEDDTAFEKQSALFALAVSDIVLINILEYILAFWCKVTLAKYFFFCILIFYCLQTPLANLEPVLREDIQKIWDTVPKPEAHKETPLSAFFNVEVVALSSFEEKEEQFKEQVAKLRQRFFHSIAPGGLAGDRQGVVPASGFSFSAQQIWKVIKENKDLDLPAHKVMVATVRCEEIANEKCANFSANEEWLQIEESVQSSPVSGFGKKLSSTLNACLSELDTDLVDFSVLVQPAYQSMLGHIRSGTLDKFKEALDKALNAGEGFSLASCTCTQSCMALFDEGCADAVIEQANWDSSKVRDKLQRDIDAHVASVRAAKLSELTSSFEAKLNEALAGPVEALLDGANSETWSAIRKLLRCETESAVAGLSSALTGFDMDEQTKDKMLTSLENYARGVVEAKAKEEAGRVLIRMKDKFSMLFSHDSDSMPRVWTGNEDIRAITKTARSASLKLLCVMVAIRLDDEVDKIESTLSSALMDTKCNAAITERSITTYDPLASSTWDEIPSSRTLITPVQCKSLWRQFKTETEYSEANKRNNNWLPPWAIVALIVLGFNEFMTLLRNPLYVGFIFVAFLLMKALWVQLDVSGEFRNGALPGLISLSTKFLPTVMNLIKRLAEEGQMPASNDPQRNPAVAAKTFRNGNGTSSEMSTASSGDCVGIIDGTHIRVKVSRKEAPKYSGRKDYPTQNVLAACTFDLKFTYVLPSWEGIASDSRIMKNALTREYPLKILQDMDILAEVDDELNNGSSPQEHCRHTNRDDNEDAIRGELLRDSIATNMWANTFDVEKYFSYDMDILAEVDDEPNNGSSPQEHCRHTNRDDNEDAIRG
ncbi:hypothetical protein GH714_036065 [Hevea brasiliensis]|uniref:GB1/RHD3-type G domain-containing protein n=1 Tax=Hevea brasiliensis TaxID=3981 RepID=A0A6A6NEI7_HEVBR|nr:hypothetical protein GH714_036065 [Hevea brasiliensis]